MHLDASGRRLFAVPTVVSAEIITAGVIDDHARRAFSQGQCHAMAYALAEKTGWDIVAVVGPTEWSTNHDIAKHIDPVTHRMSLSGLCDFAEHVLVRRGDGKLVDIRGLRTNDDVIDTDSYTAFPDPVWGVVPDDAEAAAEILEYGDWETRLVLVDPDDVPRMFDRWCSIDAARTLVEPLLASLPD